MNTESWTAIGVLSGLSALAVLVIVLLLRSIDRPVLGWRTIAGTVTRSSIEERSGSDGTDFVEVVRFEYVHPHTGERHERGGDARLSKEHTIGDEITLLVHPDVPGEVWVRRTYWFRLTGFLLATGLFAGLLVMMLTVIVELVTGSLPTE